MRLFSVSCSRHADYYAVVGLSPGLLPTPTSTQGLVYHVEILAFEFFIAD